MDTENISRRDFLKLLALFAFSHLGVSSFERKPARLPLQPDGADGRPNILILLFDTLSARHLSFFGYRRETTPNLARFAQRATVFHRHYAAGNFTTPGTASLLTGVYPWSHRGLHYYGTVLDDYIGRNIFSALSEDYYTTAFTHNAFAMGLLEQFQAHLDQLTPAKDLAILTQPVTERLFPNDYTISFWSERVIRASGTDLPGSLFLSFLGKDFDRYTPQELMEQYEELYPRGVPNNTIGLFFLLEQTIDWIQSHLAEIPRPYLGYFHLLPPHEPYMTRREFIDVFDDGWAPEPKPVKAFPQNRDEEFLANQRRYYDEYIAFVDAEFGRLVDSLERAGALEDTYLILTSDHGQLFERSIHGHVTSTLYEPLLRVPLLISRPGQTEREDVYTPTSCVDLLPTLAHIAGKPVPEGCEGQVLPTFGQAGPEYGRSIYVVEAKRNPKFAPLRTATLAIVQDHYKLIHYLGHDGKEDEGELYDLENDPEEIEDLRSSQPGIVSDLKAELLSRLDETNREYEEE